MGATCCEVQNSKPSAASGGDGTESSHLDAAVCCLWVASSLWSPRSPLPLSPLCLRHTSDDVWGTAASRHPLLLARRQLPEASSRTAGGRLLHGREGHAVAAGDAIDASLPRDLTGCLTGWQPRCAHARGIKATAAVGAVLRPSVVSTGAECCAATAVAAAKLRLSADEGCLCSYVSPAAQPRGVRTLSDGNTGPSVLRAPGSALSFTIILRCHQASRTFDYQRRVSVERSTRSVDGIEGP